MIKDTAEEICLRRFLSILDLLSIRELYNCPPSKNAIGSALNIPKLKFMNQSQKRVFAIMGNVGPNILELYFGAMVSENGINCPLNVGKGSIGTGRLISNVKAN